MCWDPRNRSCDLWRAVCFVPSAITVTNLFVFSLVSSSFFVSNSRFFWSVFYHAEGQRSFCYQPIWPITQRTSPRELGVNAGKWTNASRDRRSTLLGKTAAAATEGLLQGAKEIKKWAWRRKTSAALRNKPREAWVPFRKKQETGQAEPERFGEISAAMDISDEEERNNVFREGEALLIERNKNACRADK